MLKIITQLVFALHFHILVVYSALFTEADLNSLLYYLMSYVSVSVIAMAFAPYYFRMNNIHYSNQSALYKEILVTIALIGIFIWVTYVRLDVNQYALLLYGVFLTLGKMFLPQLAMFRSGNFGIRFELGYMMLAGLAAGMLYVVVTQYYTQLTAEAAVAICVIFSASALIWYELILSMVRSNFLKAEHLRKLLTTSILIVFFVLLAACIPVFLVLSHVNA